MVQGGRTTKKRNKTNGLLCQTSKTLNKTSGLGGQTTKKHNKTYGLWCQTSKKRNKTKGLGGQTTKKLNKTNGLEVHSQWPERFVAACKKMFWDAEPQKNLIKQMVYGAKL